MANYASLVAILPPGFIYEWYSVPENRCSKNKLCRQSVSLPVPILAVNAATVCLLSGSFVRSCCGKHSPLGPQSMLLCSAELFWLRIKIGPDDNRTAYNTGSRINHPCKHTQADSRLVVG